MYVDWYCEPLFLFLSATINGVSFSLFNVSNSYDPAPIKIPNASTSPFSQAKCSAVLWFYNNFWVKLAPFSTSLLKISWYYFCVAFRRGDQPSIEDRFTSAPFFINCITTSEFYAFASIAYIIDDLYFLSLRLTCASYWSKQSTTSIYPFSHAIINAVLPPSFGSWASTLAPAFNKMRMHSITSFFLFDEQFYTACNNALFKSLLLNASSPASSIMVYRYSESQAFAAFSISYNLKVLLLL